MDPFACAHFLGTVGIEMPAKPKAAETIFAGPPLLFLLPPRGMHMDVEAHHKCDATDGLPREVGLAWFEAARYGNLGQRGGDEQPQTLNCTLLRSHPKGSF